MNKKIFIYLLLSFAFAGKEYSFAGNKKKQDQKVLQALTKATAKGYILSLFEIAHEIRYDDEHCQTLQEMYDRFPELKDVCDKMGWTLLHEAAHRGNVELCRFLLEQGLDPYAKTGGVEDTPLHLATRVHAQAIMDLLYQEYDVDETRNTLGERPFDHECWLCPLKYLDFKADFE